MSELDAELEESTGCPSCGREFDTSKGMKLHHSQIHGETLAGVERTCEYCGDSFRVNPAYVKRGGGRYCSHKCAGIDATPGETLERECQNCGDTFTARKARVDNGEAKYCSVGCYHGDRDSQGLIERTCETCGDKFTIKKTQLNHRPAKYCSFKCMGEGIGPDRLGSDHPNWKGGYGQYYGPSWPKQRKRALERDGHKCVICGDEQLVHVHHVKRFGDFGVENHEKANDLDNLICLCPSHHGEWEGIPLKPLS